MCFALSVEKPSDRVADIYNTQTACNGVKYNIQKEKSNMEQFNNFLRAVDPKHQEFVKSTHDTLIAFGCNIKIENKASGYFVRYSHPKTKKSLLNFLFRKKGLLARIYPQTVNTEIVGNLPNTMIAEIDKQTSCDMCNEKCPGGYVFSIREQSFNKCRYNAFLFAITDESKPILTDWIKDEIKG